MAEENWQCPRCMRINRASARVCTKCGEAKQISDKKPKPIIESHWNTNQEKELLRSTYKTSPFSPSKPLVLTTKRLIIGDESRKLADILEAYNKTHGVFAVGSKLAIRFKDGSEVEITPKLEGGSFGGMLFNPELEMSKNVERWVTLINRALMSTPI